jgi:sigma-B regulation protein RsbU (phosphoserine phosphatase)
VRAGHDPAVLYDPGADTFHALGGPGIALGVDAEWVYEENTRNAFSSGQVIFLGTDGIWEARNQWGATLGREPILETIRQNAASDAARIIAAVFATLDQFVGGAKLEDDSTAVVVKM